MGEIIQRTFQTTTLLEWGIHRSECEHVLLREGLEKGVEAVVFRAPDDGLSYRFKHEFNVEAGVDDLVGSGTDDEPEPRIPEFVATQVYERLVIKTVYDPVCKDEVPDKTLRIEGCVELKIRPVETDWSPT